ncbi:MAG TPA: sigma-70 family RNA polymerase sigma factor [Actinoplanes sp.]|jgi:RNA polymerase sigma-70 factor (ECF subfamily)
MEADLVHAAQGGDAAALGAVLKEHEAGMRAVALSILGYGPDADDAVQDAMLTAVRRIGEVRDPLAVGAWLRTIVRNNCRALSRRPAPAMPDMDDVPTPDEILEKHALRDWVWHAIGELSEADRLVTLLRHFSGVTSYDQIAALCGLPVGTVRSRLSHARRTLADQLRRSADAAHPDAGALNDRRWREARDALHAAMRGDFHRVVDDMWLPGSELVAGPVRGDRAFAVDGMNGDLERGVRQKLRHVVAGPDVLIWETELSGGDCPPGAVWMHSLSGGRVSRLTLFHPK